MATRAAQIEAFLIGFFEAGAPLAGGEVTVYQEGTTTKATIYTKSDKSVEASNPVTLDAEGQSPTPIFTDENYKLLIKRADGTTFKTPDELMGTLGLWQTSHEPDWTHSAGIISDAQVAVGAAIARNKIANDTVNHNASGTHSEVTINGGGLSMRSFSTATDIYLSAANCYWTGSEWAAFDNTKAAHIIYQDSTGILRIAHKTTTNSNWASFDYTHTLLNTSGEMVLGGTGDLLTHTATAKQLVISAGAFTTEALANPAAVFESYIRAQAADSAFDVCMGSFSLPVGAIITKYTSNGYTAAAASNSVSVGVYKRGTASGVATGPSWVVLGTPANYSNGSWTGNSGTISEVVTDSLAYRIQAQIKATGAVTDSELHEVIIEYTSANLKEVM